MTLLIARALSKHYGGLNAVDGVDLTLERKEIRAIIGPNGAGKTTLVGMICGRVIPSSGSIAFMNEDITRLKPWHRVQRGIVYTFQITSVFANLSCFDNVALAVQRGLPREDRGWLGIGRRDLTDRVLWELNRVGLADQEQMTAAVLPYGHQRLLELALGLALKPKLLILDEPTQGLTEEEIADFCALAREIAGETTMLLIEHNMSVVMELADRITVMNDGRILAEGTPAEIRADRQVQEAYLGS